MSMTIEEISGMLTRLQVANQIDEDGDLRMATLGTERFVNSRGEKQLDVYLSLYELPDIGQVFSVKTVHGIFDTKGSEHRDMFLKLSSMLQAFPDPVQFVYMPNAELHARIEIPLADNNITYKQLGACIHILRQAVDESYDLLKKALETGVMDIPDKVRKALAEGEGPTDTTQL